MLEIFITKTKLYVLKNDIETTREAISHTQNLNILIRNVATPYIFLEEVEIETDDDYYYEDHCFVEIPLCWTGVIDLTAYENFYPYTFEDDFYWVKNLTTQERINLNEIED